MSRFEKALERLKTKPNDYTWKELQTVLKRLGYKEIKGSGSRRKFIHVTSNDLIILHEPHPKPILKIYALEIVIDHLIEQRFI